MSTSRRSVTAIAALALVGVAAPPAAGAAGPTSSPSAVSAASEQVVSTPMTDVGSPALSYTGRYIAYLAHDRADAALRQQLRRIDLVSGRSILLNQSIGGGFANGRYSMPPVIAADGARISFSSTSARLVAGDDNGRNDAFVRDVRTDTTLLASAALDGGAANGATGSSSMSKNGRYVVFDSLATDVVPDSGTKNVDCYRRDLTTQTTVQVTLRPDGSPSTGPGANSQDVSADGNLVAFTSYASDLAAADGNDGEADLFVRNMTTNETRWLSPGLPAGANPDGAVMSPDGRWVSTRWAVDGSLRLTRVDTAVTTAVVGNGYAVHGSFSSTMGRFVFISGGQPFVRDLASGVNTPIATPAEGLVTTVTISGNGRYAAYDFTPADGSPSVIYRVEL